MTRGTLRRATRRALLGAGAVLVGIAGLAGPTGAATTVPYTDPNAVGYIGLCNQAGQQVTSGSTTAAPFAWLAVSSTPAQPPYDGATRTAVLLAYQPQNGLSPGEWSGAELTASSRYTNPPRPWPRPHRWRRLARRLHGRLPPRSERLLQLRMYLGAADQQQYSVHYPTLDIQVQGDTSRAVDGGSVNCTAGTAESIESIVLPASTTLPPTTSASGSHGSAATTSGGTRPSGAAQTSTGGSSAPVPAGSGSTPATASATGSGASHGWIIPVVIALVLLGALAVLLVRRRPAAPGCGHRRVTRAPFRRE